MLTLRTDVVMVGDDPCKMKVLKNRFVDYNQDHWDSLRYVGMTIPIGMPKQNKKLLLLQRRS